MNIEEHLSTPIKYHCDVLICGGGFAGISAALAAAEEGAKVLFCERSFLLGGLGTAGLITIFLPLCDGYGRQVSFGLAERLLKLSILRECDGERGYKNWVLREKNSKRDENSPRYAVNFNPHLFAADAEEVLQKAGVKILYGTTAVKAIKNGAALDAVIFENKSGRFAVKCKSAVDATGDADLAYFANLPTKTHETGNLLASWYYAFNGEKVSLHQLGAADRSAEELKKGAAQIEKLSNRRFSGVEGEEISEFVALSHQKMLWDVLQKKAENPAWSPVCIPTVPQLRMTRRIAGRYEMTEKEEHKFFADSVGMVSDWRHRGPVFEVPFSALYTENCPNLFFAGRCTSVNDELWDVMRVIPCCCVTGEAAGTAAALCNGKEIPDTASLQSTLQKRGVPLHESDLTEQTAKQNAVDNS